MLRVKVILAAGPAIIIDPPQVQGQSALARWQECLRQCREIEKAEALRLAEERRDEEPWPAA